MHRLQERVIASRLSSLAVMSLRQEVLDELSVEMKRHLWLLTTWDLSIIRRRLRKQLGCSHERTLRIEREYKKFLMLILLNPEKPYGMAGIVDELWHLHVLDTLDYTKMCREVFRQYIHHLPEDDTTHRRSSSVQYKENTMHDLAEYFAGKVSRIWPTAVSGRCKSCRSCGKGHCGRIFRSDKNVRADLDLM